MTSILANRQTWADDGVLVIPDALTGSALASLRTFTNEVAAMFDSTGGDRVRGENFIGHHKGLRDMLTTGVIPEVANELIGERALLLTEKLVVHPPGSDGFRAHQHVSIYPGVNNIVGCLVCVDDVNPTNGGWEIVRGCCQLLPTDDDGCLTPTVVADLAWEPMSLTAGSLLFFHGLVPHRARPNCTSTPRQSIVLTFHPASAGNLRNGHAGNVTTKIFNM